MTSVAIVILNFNGAELIRKFLPSVVQHCRGAQIVMVDNGSTDNSSAVVRNEFPSVKLVQIATNLGFCQGYNYSLKDIDADYHVLINSDVEVTPGWLDPLIALMDSNPLVAAVQPKILSFHHRNFFEYAGAGGGFIDSLGYPFCRGRIFNSLEEDLGQYDDQREIFWASGACMVVRATLFREVGGFDDDFFAHMEEIDLCWRLQRAGYKIYYDGSSTVYHAGGSTLSAANPRKTYLNFKNGLSLIYKNMPGPQLVVKFPLRIVLDWIASVKFSFSGSWKHGAAVMNAHRDFFRGWQKERERRKRTAGFGFRQMPHQYHGFIVWDFFVAGRKKFSRIKSL
jgi:GT2 family glycosyltransferase